MGENTKKLWYIILLTSVLCYVVVGFVRWEFDWVKNLADTSSMNRLYFFMAFAAKIGLDFVLWRYIKERPKAKQRELNKDAQNYIYKEEEES